MILKRYVILLCGFAIYANCTGATVYKSVDANGNVVFTDQPIPNAEKLEIESVQTYDAQDEPDKMMHKKNAQTPENTPIIRGYKTISILSPADQDVIHDNQGNALVQVKMDPPLQKGDTLQILVDGKKAGEVTSGTTVPLTGIERGEHTVTAVIVNAGGIVLKTSPAVTVYFQQIGLNSPAHTNNPQVFHSGP